MENREDPGLDPLGISLAYEAPTNLHNSIDKGLLTADQNGRSHEDGFVSSDVLPQKDCAVGSDVTITPKSTIGMKGKVTIGLNVNFGESATAFPETLTGLAIQTI